MSERTALYLCGMDAVNNFFEMLYKAMQEAIPEALISNSGAFVWRGYRIDVYEDLAKCQYYCQIYLPSDTKESQTERYTQVQTLLFQEGYKEYHKSLEPRDRDFRINSGPYYYPFSLTLPLYKVRFFLLDRDEQYTMLRDFVHFASQQALMWQRSKARNHPDMTSPGRINGKKSFRSLHDTRSAYDRVSVDFMDAFDIQYGLLGKEGDLEIAIKKVGPRIVDKKIKWLRPNKHPNHWDFRAWRLKFEGLYPGHRSDFWWKIYYHEPEKLVCIRDDGDQKVEIGYLDVQKEMFFDLSNKKRKKIIESFVQKMLSK